MGGGEGHLYGRYSKVPRAGHRKLQPSQGSGTRFVSEKLNPGLPWGSGVGCVCAYPGVPTLEIKDLGDWLGSQGRTTSPSSSPEKGRVFPRPPGREP